MRIPDLTSTTKTDIDLPFHCAKVQPMRTKGIVGILWDTTLVFSVEKEDAAKVELPSPFASFRPQVLAALEGGGEFTVRFKPKCEIKGAFKTVSGDRQSSVVLDRKAVVRQIVLTATAKGVRVTYHVRWDGTGDELFGGAVLSDVLVDSVIVQPALPTQKRATPLPPEPDEKPVTTPPPAPAPRRGRQPTAS